MYAVQIAEVCPCGLHAYVLLIFVLFFMINCSTFIICHSLVWLLRAVSSGTSETPDQWGCCSVFYQINWKLEIDRACFFIRFIDLRCVMRFVHFRVLSCRGCFSINHTQLYVKQLWNIVQSKAGSKRSEIYVSIKIIKHMWSIGLARTCSRT